MSEPIPSPVDDVDEVTGTLTVGGVDVMAYIAALEARIAALEA